MTQLTNGHILVVDDEYPNRDLLSRLLTREGYTVSQAANGAQALELIKVKTFNLVLLDIMMPDMDGIMVLREARKLFSMTELPVIMVTALDESDRVSNALALHANDYITKPFEKKILLARVKTQLDFTRDFIKITDLASDVSRRNKMLLKLFGRYVSDEVAENLMDSPSAAMLGGKLQTVSMLFADLRDFTEIASHMSPPRVVQMLNNFFDVMIDIVHKYHGTVDKLMGDEILATFGTPHVRPDDAQRALACALEMQRAMQSVNLRNIEHELPELQMGIGINTGEVVVGNIGSEKHTNYSVIGKHVNLAARIQSFAEGGEILITDATFIAGGDKIWVNDKREITPKGIDHAVIVYRLSGMGGSNSLSNPPEGTES